MLIIEYVNLAISVEQERARYKLKQREFLPYEPTYAQRVDPE